MEKIANDMPLKVETNNVADRSSKKSGKEEKSKKKDDKNVDQVMKALNNLESPEQKLAAMCKKYADVMDENRKLQLTTKQLEKGLNVVQREKEQLQTDHSKAILTRSRLESLCRELQKQNKAVKEESLLKVREEEEKRKEVSAKFNSTLSEITTLMSSSNEKTNKLRDENVDITNKFRSICEQSGLQQQQVDKMNMQRKLEAELNEAKLTKQKLEFSAEKEVLLRDKQQLLMDLQEARTRVNDVLANEINLKAQVQLYADRYEEFQNALTRSNEVFGGFKGEMDKMTKKIVKLEKETLSWKSRWEKSHQALLDMATDKQQRDGELAHVNRQLTQLQKLCRTLQTERAGFLAQIKGSGKATGGSGDELAVDLALTEDCTVNDLACSTECSNNLVDSPVLPKLVAQAPVQPIKSTEKVSKVEEPKLESPVAVDGTKNTKAGIPKANKKVKLIESPVPVLSESKVDVTTNPIETSEKLVKETPVESPTVVQEPKVQKGGHPKTNKKAKLNAEMPKPKDQPITIVKSTTAEKAVINENSSIKVTEQVVEKEQSKGLEDIKICTSAVNEPAAKEVDPTKAAVINQIEPVTDNNLEEGTVPAPTANVPVIETPPKPSSSAPEVPPAKPDKVVPNENKKGKEGAKKRKK